MKLRQDRKGEGEGTTFAMDSMQTAPTNFLAFIGYNIPLPSMGRVVNQVGSNTRLFWNPKCWEYNDIDERR